MLNKIAHRTIHVRSLSKPHVLAVSLDVKRDVKLLEHDICNYFHTACM